ncbi:hypothetical protein Nepgr_030663 [Nepenthes gracilis]|uniref:EndoU domain-containing protein n=1 Tax=Nepenthes gracilis TaxID=150966 RepID=A0AAD3TF04_NEPGR|nr:hypothetical protein Nepgr_030663 [Nepenthes gracilis]
MESLIKGLIDVALGGHDDERDEDDSSTSQSREERSRSTWAQVVSGEQDDDLPHSNERRHDDRDHKRWNKEEHNYGINEDGQSAESRPSHRPQKAVHESYREDEKRCQNDYIPNRMDGRKENSGDWQTVYKKPIERPQKVHMDHWNTYKRPPNEQEYSEAVEDSVELDPSEGELADLPQACNKLWELDFNRLVPGKDYEIDCGEGKKAYDKEDRATESLFKWVGEDVLRRPTFSRFCSLLDNYNPNEGYKEEITNEERQEQVAFIEEISRTAPIKYLYNYLSSKGSVSGSYHEFKRLLMELWFSLYGRGGTRGSSSAFEHVFVGEIKQHGEREVSGFHNWLQFYLEEAKGRVDYQGYILPRRHGQFPDSETQLLTIQFEWNGVLKSVSSSFIGVSPEFEVALYTLCFFAASVLPSQLLSIEFRIRKALIYTAQPNASKR